MCDRPFAYCPNCVKNVPHYRSVRSTVLAYVDQWLGEFLRSIRIGPWYCLHCERCTIIRRPPRADAVDYRIVDPTDPIPNSDSSWTRVSDLERSDGEIDEPTEPVGNYIKSEKSLVVRSSRLLRFSEKYRDAVVDRLLSGEDTFADIRYEKNISERELLDWIADRLERAERQLATPMVDSNAHWLEVIPRQSQQPG